MNINIINIIQVILIKADVMKMKTKCSTPVNLRDYGRLWAFRHF